MRKLLVAIPVLTAVGLLFAQDRPKEEVERPVKKAVSRLDLPKSVVELPIKELVAAPAPAPEKLDL